MELTEKEYIELDKLIRKVERLHELIKQQQRRIDRLETEAKKATGAAHAAILEVGKVKGKKVRADILTKNKIKNYPSAEEWVEWMKDNFSTYSVTEVDKRFRNKTMMTTDSMRQELAIRFGNHLADETYITNYTLNRLIRQAGIRTGVENRFSTINGVEKYHNIILCVKK